MRVAISADDNELSGRLAAEAEGAGYESVLDVAKADVLVLGASTAGFVSRMRRALTGNPRMDVLGVLERALLSELPEELSDVALLPLIPGEIGARLDIIARRRGRQGTTRRDLLAKAVESAGDVVEITDPRARWSYVNPAFTRTLGYSAEEALGKSPAELMRSSMHDKEYFLEIDRILSEGRVWQGLLISRAKDGRLVHLESTIAPVRDTSGRITHHVAVKRDISERIATEARLTAANEELEQARDAALEASRTKSQFLANMSHELRTPLNAIIGYSEMLIEETQEAGKDTDDLVNILSAGNRLLSLITDLLDLSKIEAGRMELDVSRFPLRPLLDEIVEMVGPLANECNNRIRVTVGLDARDVSADRLRLRQVLLNLISNANKFTDSGSIEIELRAAADSDEHYEIVVSDSGIGISADQRARLFRPFVQADNSPTRAYGGSGLGLVISQRLCQMMGGGIKVESELGVGSRFTVRLPLDVSS